MWFHVERTHGTTVAVFDLDGCLLSGDSTAHWVFQRLRRNPLRLLGALLWSLWAARAIRPLRTRTRATRGYLWLATVGRSEAALDTDLARFLEALRAGRTPLRPVPEALARWGEHRHAGHRVVLISGTLTPVARAMADWFDALSGYTGARAEAYGSDPMPYAGGWSVVVHRHSEAKSALLGSLGLESWDYAYSDSWDDAPLLRGARAPVLVRPSGRSERAARAELGERVLVIAPRKR